MASLNKVNIIGNLGKDPEVRYTPNGSAVCQLTVATSRKWKNKDTGDAMEETEWHRVVFYDRLAEVCGEYLKKGSSLYVEGRLKTRKWQDKEGADRYTTEIVGEQMQMLGGKGESAPAPPAQRPAARTPAAKPAQERTGFDGMPDDPPF